MSPSCSRKGSLNSSIVASSSAREAARVLSPTGPPLNFSARASSIAISDAFKPLMSTPRRVKASSIRFSSKSLLCT